MSREACGHVLQGSQEAVDRGRWLTPEGLAVFADAPTEDLGPDIYKRPDAK